MNSSERIVTVIDSLGGIATRRQLVDRGFFGPQLTAAVRWGSIRRLRRGWYATASANAQAAIAVRVGGRLSHTSAARLFELWAGLDDQVHVTVTQGASRLRKVSFDLTSSVVIHWTAPGRQQLTALTTWRVSLEECLLGMVRFCDAETAIACLSMAMSIYGFTPAEFTLLFAAESTESRRRAALAREGSDSGAESIAFQRFVLLGFAVEQQVDLDHVGWVDMVLNGRLVVEIDGFEFHSTRKSKNEDYRRDAELTKRNIPHLRFSYTQVMFEWEFVEATVRAALATS